MKMMLTQDWKEKYSRELENQNPELKVIKALTREKQQTVLQEAEAVLGFTGSMEMDLLAGAPQLIWIQVLSAGVDRIMTSEYADILRQKEVAITNVRGLHRDIIAEHTLALMLSFTRRLPEFYRQQQRRIWKRLPVDYLGDKKIVILGLGAIGKEIARRAGAFNMTVVGVKRSPEEVPGVVEIYFPNQLKEAFQDADFITAVLPLTPETRQMLGEDEFAAMPDKAVFINVGRGRVVKEKALISALQQGKLAGAALDVFQDEPLEATSPFYEMNNVIITPHIAGSFPDYYNRALNIVCENLKRYLNDRELINQVDYSRGY